MSERSGIEIDYCPQCRGVWLDRGELDKIVERSTALNGSRRDDDRFDDRRADDRRFGDGRSRDGRRRDDDDRGFGGFLGDLFG